jgi:hypothetical protein
MCKAWLSCFTWEHILYSLQCSLRFPLCSLFWETRTLPLPCYDNTLTVLLFYYRDLLFRKTPSPKIMTLSKRALLMRSLLATCTCGKENKQIYYFDFHCFFSFSLFCFCHYSSSYEMSLGTDMHAIQIVLNKARPLRILKRFCSCLWVLCA